LTRPDFSKTEVVKVYVYIIVVPPMDYWKQTIEVKKGAQLERMNLHYPIERYPTGTPYHHR
jgi:hypothetical protein